MKCILIFVLFFSAKANCQTYAFETSLKKPAFQISNIDQYQDKKYFVVDAKDKDTIVNSLEKYLRIVTQIGRSRFPFADTKAGNTTIKVLSKPMAYGDRYSISAETMIDNNIWRIMFGNEKTRNNITAERIKKFLSIIKGI